MSKPIWNFKNLQASFILATLLTTTYSLSSHAEVASCGIKDGINLPCWTDFKSAGEGDESLPFYPYAKRPNGCSIPFAKPGTHDEFKTLGKRFSFKESCTQHDKCYYDLSTNVIQCNTQLTDSLNKVCRDGVLDLAQLSKDKQFILAPTDSAAVSRCYARAEVVSAAVIAAQMKYYYESQEAQKEYLNRVVEYVEQAKAKN